MGLLMAVVNHTSSEFFEYEYAHLESETNRQMLHDCIRSDVLKNEKIIRLHEMTELPVSYLTCLGVEDI